MCMNHTIPYAHITQIAMYFVQRPRAAQKVTSKDSLIVVAVA